MAVDEVSSIWALKGLYCVPGTDLVWKLKEVAEHLIRSAFRKFTGNTVKN